MMRAAIHQPHYFPWLGYFAKMAVSDKFILLDCVQFEKGSQMIRNQVVDSKGNKRFITIMGDTKGYLDKEYRDIQTKDIEVWTKKQLDALSDYYRYAPYKNEILVLLKGFFEHDHNTICKWTCESIFLVRELLEIQTDIIFQSDIQYDADQRKSDLILALCQSLKIDTYVSGMGGSVKYLNQEAFAEKGVKIEFFVYEHPAYKQCHYNEFKSGLSCLDILFNCGVEETKRIFHESIGRREVING